MIPGHNDNEDQRFMRRFRSIEIRQEGGAATVFQAKCKRTSKPCAVKVVKLHNSLDRKRFAAEVKAATTLSHCKNIVTTKLHHTTRSTGFLVMKLKRYELLERLSDYQTEDTVRAIFRQIAKGISSCHSMKIAHLDIKPENVLVSSRGKAYICDFGSAHMFDEPIEAPFGTSTYRAPESYQSWDFDKAAADIWSMGVLLYIILTGVYPFDGETREEVIESIKFGRIDLGELDDMNCSCSARDLLLQMLQVDPKKRPSIGQVLEHPFLCK